MIQSQFLSTLQSLPTLENHLNTIESNHLKTSYHLGNLMEKESDPVSLRMQAIAIPILCLFGELIKISIDVKRIAQMSYRSMQSLSFKTGNIRIGATHACEHLRNIAGIASGLFIGLYSPLTARKLFLTVKAEKLQRKLNPDTAATLYAVAYAVSKFFKKHGIDYRICSGTLLGTIRHKGIIPWDDDMDLMIHPSCVEKCKKLFEKGKFTRETGIEVKKQPFTGGWECFHPNSPKGEGALKTIGLPFVDIFRTQHDETGEKIIHGSKKMQQLFTEEYFSTKEWANSKEYPCGPTQLSGVIDANAYLNRHYGSDAIDFAYQLPHHDVLASVYANPLDILGLIHKAWQYDLPRRTYLVDRTPIEVNVKKYEEYVQKIDNSLKKSR